MSGERRAVSGERWAVSGEQKLTSILDTVVQYSTQPRHGCARCVRQIYACMTKSEKLKCLHVGLITDCLFLLFLIIFFDGYYVRSWYGGNAAVGNTFKTLLFSLIFCQGELWYCGIVILWRCYAIEQQGIFQYDALTWGDDTKSPPPPHTWHFNACHIQL